MKTKKLVAFISLLTFYSLHAQFTLAPSGTSVNLKYISAINNNIMVSGTKNAYMIKSYDECANLQNIGPNSYININYDHFAQRFDTSVIFTTITTTGSAQGAFLKSFNGGNSWNFIAGLFGTPTGYYADSLVGYSGGNSKTVNGGINSSPMNLSSNFNTNIYGLYFPIRTYRDSCVSYCGYYGSLSAFAFSKDQGNTWNYPVIQDASHGLANDVAFINHDSIMALTNKGQVYFTVNSGQSWKHMYKSPVKNPTRIYYKKGKGVFVIGADSLYETMVARTDDYGATWKWVKTGHYGLLYDMAVVNDSIAIMVGWSGMIIRWNYVTTKYNAVGLNENGNTDLPLLVYPNPAKDRLIIESAEYVQVEIFNGPGQLISETESNNNYLEINVSEFPPGVYSLIIKTGSLVKTIKWIKK